MYNTSTEDFSKFVKSIKHRNYSQEKFSLDLCLTGAGAAAAVVAAAATALVAVFVNVLWAVVATVVAVAVAVAAAVLGLKMNGGQDIYCFNTSE